MNVAVFGLGKIGLPVSLQIASKGHYVYGIDTDESVVKQLNSSKETFPGEINLLKKLTEARTSNNFQAFTNLDEVKEQIDVFIVAVPLVLNSLLQPDFKNIDDVTYEIARKLSKGNLISIETTLPVGTTRNRILRNLEKMTLLSCPEDFYLVFSPERLSSGRAFEDLSNYPKIVGGISYECSEVGSRFYEKVIDFKERTDLLPKYNGVWKMNNSEEAEYTKLIETIYRDVNIGLANIFARNAKAWGLDIFNAIEAANSQPFSHIHNPGISVGGHCIPVYPHLYSFSNKEVEPIMNFRAINESMPNYSIDLIQSEVGSLKNKNILVLGVVYRYGVKEDYLSGAYVLKELLNRLGSNTFFCDDLFSDSELRSRGLNPLSGNHGSIEIVIGHSYSIQNFKDFEKKYPKCKLIFLGKDKFSSKEIKISDSIRIIGI